MEEHGTSTQWQLVIYFWGAVANHESTATPWLLGSSAQKNKHQNLCPACRLGDRTHRYGGATAPSPVQTTTLATLILEQNGGAAK